ncbi:MAG: hypothetical protein J7K94_06735 [Dehalococcoidia bacterium]|nr:hypothetical protein [Dehalococcoidia bacterium]
MNNEVRPTWKLAWGLWWRIALITLGVYAIIGAIVLLLGISLIPWESLTGIFSAL